MSTSVKVTTPVGAVKAQYRVKSGSVVVEFYDASGRVLQTVEIKEGEESVPTANVLINPPAGPGGTASN